MGRRRDVTVYEGGGRHSAAPHANPIPSRSSASRTTDTVTEALGHESAFPIAVGAVAVWILLGLVLGLHIQVVSAVATLATLVMVFAVQHTSSREAQALNLKLDELIRVSEARNDLIGAEHQAHAALAERRRELLDVRHASDDTPATMRRMPDCD